MARVNGYYRLRWAVFERDGFACQYCGRTAPDVVLQVDHRIPVSKGGTNHMNNLATSCAACNYGRGAQPLRLPAKSFEPPPAQAIDQIEYHLAESGPSDATTVASELHLDRSLVSRYLSVDSRFIRLRRDGKRVIYYLRRPPDQRKQPVEAPTQVANQSIERLTP